MKKVVRLVLFVAVVLLINGALNFIFISATEPHRIQNHELYSSKDKYELIAFGPSDCMSHFDSPYASEILGLKCFNYGQSGTTYTCGAVRASYENALSCQKPQIALFFVSQDNLYKDSDVVEPAKTFIHSTIGMTNKFAKLKYYLTASYNDEALERIFQWKDIVTDKELPTVFWCRENVKNKLSKEYRTYNIEWRNSIQDKTVYVGNGFVARPSVKEYEDEKPYSIKVQKEYETPEYVDGYDLDTMISACKKRDIKPYVIMGPMSIELICEENGIYNEKSDCLKAIAEKNDVDYIDMNYIKKEVFRPSGADWADARHLDIDGAKAYTKALCEVINKKQKGEDVSDMFYPSFLDFLKSYDNVTILE